MAQIFISYSRADVNFVEELVPLINTIFPEHTVWYDRQIVGGEDWWKRILREIDSCDLFIYLLSNDSLNSTYCQSEFKEALRLQKKCLPVIVRPKTNVELAPDDLEPELRRRNWVDMEKGFKIATQNARLWNAINIALDDVPDSHPQPYMKHLNQNHLYLTRKNKV